jgi:hypothetical protein
MNNTELAVKLTALNSTLATLQNLNVASSILNNLKKEIAEVEKEINEQTINGGLFELLQTTILEFCTSQNITNLNLNLNITMDAGACVISKIANKKVTSSGEGSASKIIENKYGYEIIYNDKTNSQVNLTNLWYRLLHINSETIDAHKKSMDIKDNYNALLSYMNNVFQVKISHTNIFEKLEYNKVIELLKKCENISDVAYIKTYKNGVNTANYILNNDIFTELEVKEITE